MWRWSVTLTPRRFMRVLSVSYLPRQELKQLPRPMMTLTMPREAIAPSQADLQLTPAEHSAISTYTRVSYETLNHSLWNGTIDDVSAVAAFSHDLSAGLAKLPDYEGAVLRGSHPDRPAAAYDLERYESGSVVIENGSVSY